ncbi:MAG: carboxypeptidase regulatory-like domain-containing protein [Vicinamibacterales bacterium]
MRALRISVPVRTAVALGAAALLATSAIAQPRGNARLTGKVVDEQGAPVPDVNVRAQMTGQTDVLSAKSDKKGEWRLNGAANGEWKVELSKAGLETATEVIEVKDNNAPPLTVKLLKKGEAKADPMAEVNGQVQKAAELAQAGKIPEARKIYEDLLAKYPQIYQLEGFIARTYAAENNIPQAIEHLKINLEKEPTNVDLKLFQAELLMESGDKAGAAAILNAIDLKEVKDPYTYINQAISLINDKKGPEAVELLTKLIAQFPASNELYYYRGRAYVASDKLEDARADLEKFVSLAPNAKEAADAKKILDQIKK